MTGLNTLLMVLGLSRLYLLEIECSRQPNIAANNEKLAQIINLDCPLGEIYYEDKCVRAECPPTPTCSMIDWGVKKVYPPDCTKYILCESTAIITDCPAGLHFSPTEFNCMDPALANCPSCGGQTTVETPSDQETTMQDTTVTSILQDSTTETQFAETASENFADTTVSSTETTVPICPPTPTCALNETGILKPYPPDCAKYIYCNGSVEGELRLCAINLHFFEVYQTCIDPELANCVYCVEGP